MLKISKAYQTDSHIRQLPIIGNLAIWSWKGITFWTTFFHFKNLRNSKHPVPSSLGLNDRNSSVIDNGVIVDGENGRILASYPRDSEVPDLMNSARQVGHFTLMSGNVARCVTREVGTSIESRQLLIEVTIRSDEKHQTWCRKE